MKGSNDNFLAPYGYNLVVLPRTDLVPLTLLCQEGDHLESLHGTLDLLFEPDLAPLPLPVASIADVEGQKKMAYEFKTGLSFLDELLQRLGLSKGVVKVEAGGSSSLQVSFAFQEVSENKIGLLDLDNFLSGAIPREGDFRTYAERLINSELFVITSTLKAGGIKVEAQDDNGLKLALEADLFQTGQAGASIKQDRQKGITIRVPKGKELVFGFKAVQILYEQKRWFEFWRPDETTFRIRNQTGAVLKGEEDFPVRPLPISQSALVFE